MKNLCHVSRNFVEFGPFTSTEIADFKSRGILNDHDYVRADKDHHWKTLAAWIKETSPAIPAEKPAAKKSSAPRKKASSAAKTPKKAA